CREVVSPEQSSHVQGRCNQCVWCNIRQRSHYSIERDLGENVHIFSCRVLYDKRSGPQSSPLGSPCRPSAGGVCSTHGGALASTHRWKHRRHVEDGSLASLKTGPKQINADHEDLALAA